MKTALTMAVQRRRIVCGDRQEIRRCNLSLLHYAAFRRPPQRWYRKNRLEPERQIIAQDLTSSLKSGTTGLITGAVRCRARRCRQVLVAASDKREAKAAYFYEMWFGDGAASLLVGETRRYRRIQGLILGFL